MKKIFIAIAAIALSTAAKAQTTYSAGLEVGLPSGVYSNLYNVGFGASVKAYFGDKEKAGFTGTAGFISLAGKNSFPSLSMIPVKVGYRYNTNNLYLEPQAGLTFLSGSGTGSGFTWAANVGYYLSDNIDLSARYESALLTGGSLNIIGLRLAYAFGGK
jgi:hypothetical protein